MRRPAGDITDVEKAGNLLPVFFSKYSDNVIPATEFRYFLAQYGINPNHVSMIIMSLSAKGKVYTFKGSNGRVYLVKNPDAFNKFDLLRKSNDPLHRTLAYVNSLLSIYSSTRTYVEIRKLYRKMHSDYKIKSTKWFTMTDFTNTLAKLGYVEGFSSGTHKYVKPTKKLFQEYPSGLNYENVQQFYDMVFPLLRKQKHHEHHEGTQVDMVERQA